MSVDICLEEWLSGKAVWGMRADEALVLAVSQLTEQVNNIVHQLARLNNLLEQQ